MGYLTYHTGHIKFGNIEEKEVALAIARLPYWDCADDDIETINDVIACDEVKWYGCVEDMKKVSAQFPGITIEICGEGEEAGDMWKAYFKDGKAVVYQAEITFPEYCENDLR
ncbi:MAG: hypothetical protein K2O54_03050 [Prevotella sp.]|nr:hypothetical protein [Prevotella sp.]